MRVIRDIHENYNPLTTEFTTFSELWRIIETCQVTMSSLGIFLCELDQKLVIELVSTGKEKEFRFVKPSIV